MSDKHVRMDQLKLEALERWVADILRECINESLPIDKVDVASIVEAEPEC